MKRHEDWIGVSILIFLLIWLSVLTANFVVLRRAVERQNDRDHIIHQAQSKVNHEAHDMFKILILARDQGVEFEECPGDIGVNDAKTGECLIHPPPGP